MYIPVDREAFLPLLGSSALMGGIFGVIGDGFTIRRRMMVPLFRQKRNSVTGMFQKKSLSVFDGVLTFIEDILMALICAVSLILLSYKWNYGQIRLFSLVAALLGYILYRKTISRVVLWLVEKVGRILFRVLRRLFGVTLLPLVRLFEKWFRRIIRYRKKRNALRLTKKEEQKALLTISR